MAVTCTPSEVLEKYKCLACIPQSEQLMILGIALAVMNGYDPLTELSTIREESKCFTCLTESQQLQAIVAILGDYFLSSYTIDELYEMIHCARCANGNQVRAAIVYLICKYYGGR